MGFGKQVLALRKAQSRSQEELARCIGVHKKNISRWENEEVTPNVHIAAQVAQALGVSLDSLLADELPVQIEQAEPIKAVTDPELAELIQACMDLPKQERNTLKKILRGLLGR